MMLSRVREIKVIDRTIPEVYLLNKRISRFDIFELCWLLKDMGVDIIEINSEILKKIGKLPSGIEFQLRAGPEDVGKDLPSAVKHCIVSADHLKDTAFIKGLSDKKLKLTAEFKIDGPERLDRLKKLKNTEYVRHIDNIRITGLNRCFMPDWTKKLKEVRNVLGMGIDICPENNYFCATSMAVEAVMEGTDAITAAFAGYGKERNFAPIEEVMAAIKILISPETKMNLGILPEICRCYSRMTGISVPSNKPILGDDIFKYEAGIHADGIEKNPLTYEPFEPDFVGRKRELKLGKHSGKGAVISKLGELGINISVDRVGEILINIKDKSIKLGRSLLDDEILEICKLIKI